jgi:2-polyprenyl-6-methoxyphenol hydroxylase-like FAD-dependent oxidoreductase
MCLLTEPVEVVIKGGGVAACCSAYLLDRAGIPVALEGAQRARVPAIMLGDATQSLIADVFDQKDLFRGLHRIERRVVAWGPKAEPRILPHSAVVISEQQLSERLRPVLRHVDRRDAALWTILASQPLPSSSVEHHFGSRVATATPVKLNDRCDPACCWIESLEQGWLFLIPGLDGAGWLLSVGAQGGLLERSRIIADQIEHASSGDATFAAYPRIAQPICGDGWLACGTAAMAFDPLCGDGTGHAIREAILAAAVIRGVAGGLDVDQLLSLYRARLLAGFKRHLEQCSDFYATGHQGAWWETELQHLLRGIEWSRTQSGDQPEFRYQLKGFELERI